MTRYIVTTPPNRILSTTTMPWPAHIVAMFDSIPAGGLADVAGDEALLYGPINMLLIHLFPPIDLYIVSPQRKRQPEGFAIDFTTVFVVQKAQHPVFFMEVKPAGAISNRSTRGMADDQMRNRFDELIDNLSIPVLYGVSTLGPRLCIYTYSKAENTLSPPIIHRHPTVSNDRAPAARWDIDLLSEEGVEKLTALADHVKRMVNDLLRHT